MNHYESLLITINPIVSQPWDAHRSRRVVLGGMAKETGLVPKDILDANNCPFVPLGKNSGGAGAPENPQQKWWFTQEKLGFHGISWRII